MFHQGTRPCTVLCQSVDPRRNCRRELVLLIATIELLFNPSIVSAQRGMGHGSRPLICVHDCSNRGDEARPEDDLKDFNRIMAVQATPEQSAAFVDTVRDMQSADAELQKLRDLLQKKLPAPSLSKSGVAVNLAVDKARTGVQAFLASFSPLQKSGLRELTRKLEVADNDVTKDLSSLRGLLESQKATEQSMTDSTASLEKGIASFQKEQLALGGEMGIILPTTELTFNLPLVMTAVDIAGDTVTVPVSASASRTFAVEGHNVFALQFVADLSDLQDKIADILRARLPKVPVCGVRVELREARVSSEPPATRVITQLHLERWICPPHQAPLELADGEGEFDVQLTPKIEKNATLQLVSETARLNADGFVHDSLVGDIGEQLRDEITTSFLASAQRSTDPNLILPAVAKEMATMQKAEFHQQGGHLTLVTEGRLEFSDDQVNQFATQLREQVSARQTPPQ